MPKSLYRIPLLKHKLTAKTKAEVNFRNFPRLEVEVIVEASSDDEAYRMLCATYLPDDDRPIEGKSLINNFRAS